MAGSTTPVDGEPAWRPEPCRSDALRHEDRTLKPAAFSYVRPDSIDGALALLERYGDEAKVMAGGQSLVPMMNFRLARPQVIVDIARVDELTYCEHVDGTLRIGAATTQRAVETDPQVHRAHPGLTKALGFVGHVQTRNRGTIGGSVAHADPSAEVPAVLLASDASVRLRSSQGERWVRAADFFVGPYETTLLPTELITEIRLNTVEGESSTFVEVAPRTGDFATCAVAAVVRFDDADVVQHAALSAIGVDARPVRLAHAEECVTGRSLSEDTVRASARASRSDVQPLPDLHSTAAYRLHLLSVLVARALRGLRRATT